MNKEQLQGLLNQKYIPENWNKIYGSIFPNVMLFASPKEIAVSEQWVKSFRQRGLVRLDGNQDVAIFEVVLQDGISVQSKRVGLRNLVAKLIDEYQNHGVLAVFDNGSPEYRFTFAARETKVTREGIEKTETDSKRYTYILGETETCKTAAEQFIKLAEKGTGISLTDLRDAFSVEKLSKQFFNEYKEQYNHFVSYLASQPRILKSVFSDDEKKMRDFVKILLGRLVFLQFVQKKKWLGVPAKNKDWHSGDVRFLVNAFNGFSNKDKFYSDYLEEFFFECLNNPNRKNEIFELSGTKVPFLNGGLFENDNAKTKNLNFPSTYFTELFEFFGKYNFTIDENDPTEKEVGIDPEMLGSIFENLLEDNKDKGAFYTPKEIVHYMCQESLIEYLNTKVNEKQDEGISESIRVFITKRKTDEHILKLVSPLAIAMREVKICDPAIGSGAFPMGMLMEIFHAVFELFNVNPKIVSKEWNMNGWQPNVVKSNIIQNSIYGVDIEKGAVDIARLRFWLSLIVDEEEPKALPNLDYKIVVGNSLINKLGDEIIDIVWEVKANTNSAKKLQQEIQNNLNKLFNTQKLFFDFNGKKENLKAEIRNLKIDVLISQLQLDKYKYGNSSAQIGILFEMTAKEKSADQERKQKLTSFDKTILELQRLKSNPDLPLNFFDWKLDFPDVLNENINPNPGFDVVIANPPYINIANISDEVTRNYIQRNYATVKNKSDLYSVFIERAHYLTACKGKICFIFPKTWMGSDSFSKFREFFTDNFRIKNIINLGYGIFDNATVSTVISLFSKESIDEHSIELYQLEKNPEGQSIFNRQENRLSYSQIKSTPQFLYSFEKQIDIKIKTVPLSNLIDFSLGIKTSDDSKFIIDFKKDNDTYPMLRGKNIRRYEHDKPTEFIWYKPHLMMKKVGAGPRRLEYFLQEKILIQGICNGVIRCSYDNKKLLVNDKIHIAFNARNYSIKSIMAIMNSKLMSFISRATFGNYLEIKINQLELLPFPKTLSKRTDKIILDLVDSRIKCNVENDKLKIESMIDCLIFKIYQFSYNEAKALYPEITISKEEYENISLE
jgi:adenine-specific DNA-methyltransferase